MTDCNIAKLHQLSTHLLIRTPDLFQIYSLYSKNRNFLHELSRKDKVQQGRIVGEKRTVEINDKHVLDLLENHLGRLITGDDTKFV